MVIGGRKVAKISFIPSCRGTHWNLENQCLVNFKSCKSVEIMGCLMLQMTFYNAILCSLKTLAPLKAGWAVLVSSDIFDEE